MNTILQITCFFLLLYLLATRGKGGVDGKEKEEKMLVAHKVLDVTEAVQGDPASVQDGEVGLGNE